MSSVVKIICVLLIVTFGVHIALAQNDDRWLVVDEFGRLSNDDLLGRVVRFYETLDKRNDAVAYVVLYGPPTTQYLNQRRIEGCSRWLQRLSNRFEFVFGPEDHPTQAQAKFLLVTKDAKITTASPDYKLPDLKKPLELSSALTTDEYCPRYFDLDWFANFMTANPTFRGKVIIDSSHKDFVRRVTKYRKELSSRDIMPSRVKFSRRHFQHERDEQWWLIPAKLK